MHSKSLALIFLGVAFGTIFTVPVYSQVKEWGDINREDLEKKVYSPDSNASAVVLFDYGRLWFENQLEFYFEQHVRIKILDSEGYKWGDITIPFNEEYDQEIEDIEAITYTYDLHGNQIIKHVLGKGDIYEERIINDWKQKKFAMPALEPGAIIEYRYRKKIGDPGVLPDWEFDRSIPVKWSEFRAEIPNILRFFLIRRVFHEMYKSETENFTKTINFSYDIDTGSYGIKSNRKVQVMLHGQRFRLVMRNLPALDNVPFITTVDNYKSKIFLQLSALEIPERGIQKDYAKTWDSIIEKLNSHGQFGKRLSSGRWSRSLVNRILEDDMKNPETLDKIYRYVSNSFVWDGVYGIFAEDKLEEVAESKQGNGAELNLLLIQLLRDAGISATPLLISTRDHGRVIKKYVLPNQFNHVIAYVRVNGENYLLDATGQNLPAIMLPENDLNGEGLLISRTGITWIPLENKEESRKSVVVNASMGPDGSLSGHLVSRSTGYYASEERNLLGQWNPERQESFQTLFPAIGKANLSSMKFLTDQPVKDPLSFEVSFKDSKLSGIQTTDSFIYLNLISFLPETKNPFQEPERKLPIEFPYLFTENYIMNISIPEGYTVVELPKSKGFRLPNEAARFQCMLNFKDGRIGLNVLTKLNQIDFDTTEYKLLREFYRLIIEALNERIVLQKQNE